ncbi:MATH domain and coiled-coil domain-containing protein At3g44790 [Eutrema salsugineum]|nr:MATH domain and coiled-coil domain-containing protein At3g44790 [Eutrema salsugineum]
MAKVKVTFMSETKQTLNRNEKLVYATGVLGFGCEESSSMPKQIDKKKFTWVIKNFSSLESDVIYSDEFIAGGCKWRLVAFPKGYNNTSDLSLYLVVANAESLPCGWRIHAVISLSVVNQCSEKVSQVRVKKKWFDEKDPEWGFKYMIRLEKLMAKNGGFMVDNEVKIVAEVHVLEVIGDLDVSDKSEEVTQPLKKIKIDVAGTSDLLKESPSDCVVNVNGFKVLSSQAELVKLIFQRHPDIAIELQVKNQHLRTACMYVLLKLIDTLCQKELSYDDLVGVDSALTYVKDSGFKVDWLEKKLEEVKEKKMEEQIGETLRQELEKKMKDCKQKCSEKEALLEKENKELKDLKQKCLDIEALLEKEKAKVLATVAAPLTLDDVV